jgi:hypothetical protein
MHGQGTDDGHREPEPGQPSLEVNTEDWLGATPTDVVVVVVIVDGIGGFITKFGMACR